MRVTGREGDGGGDCAADGGGGAGHSEVGHGAAAGGDLVHLGEFVGGGGEADLQPLGFAGPAFPPGLAEKDPSEVAARPAGS